MVLLGIKEFHDDLKIIQIKINDWHRNWVQKKIGSIWMTPLNDTLEVQKRSKIWKFSKYRKGRTNAYPKKAILKKHLCFQFLQNYLVPHINFSDINLNIILSIKNLTRFLSITRKIWQEPNPIIKNARRKFREEIRLKFFFPKI